MLTFSIPWTAEQIHSATSMFGPGVVWFQDMTPFLGMHSGAILQLQLDIWTAGVEALSAEARQKATALKCYTLGSDFKLRTVNC